YAEIGGRSPLLEFTRRQATALEAALRQEADARVVIAMRYWHPLTAEAIAELERFQPEEVVLLPLYPQFSKTTTQSSVNEWNRRFHTNGWRPRVHLVQEFYRDPDYIHAVVRAIHACLAACPHTDDLDMVFSAHSV